MRIRAALWTAALALTPSVVTSPAAAEAPPGSLERDAKEMAEDARKALDRAQRDATRAAQAVKQDMKAAGKEISKALRDVRDKLRTTRDERRTAQRRELRDRYGTLLAKPRVQEELRTHFQRLARLDYIEAMADDMDQDKIQDRAKKARDLENERHDLRMATLRSKGGEE